MSESRFQHLLQPINDLATNWNIDIANELESYLEELDSITFSSDDGESNLNFAEAALVIQGTTCIYSKKVEHLYALVYQTLDHLSQQKKSSHLKANDEDGNSESDEPLEYEFLPMYDNLPEGKDINYEQAKSREAKKKSDDFNFQESIALMGMLLSEQNDTLESLKICSSIVHPCGALLIEESCKDYLSTHNRAIEMNSTRVVISQMKTLEDQESIHAQPQDECMDSEPDDDGGVDYNVDFGYDDDMETLNMNQQKNTRNININDDIQEEDLWKTLDPHDAFETKGRPFRKGKTFRIPQEVGSMKETETSSTLGDFEPFFMQVVPMEGLRMKEYGDMLRQIQKKQRLAFKESEKGNHMKYNSSQLAMNDADDNDDNDDDDDAGYEWGGMDTGGLEAEDEVDDNYSFNPQTRSLSDVFNGESHSYEDLCRTHLDEFMKGAEKYVKETSLMKKVATWQERLTPLLTAEDARPVFDIYKCGNDIVSALEQETNPVGDENASTISFEKVVKGLDRYEICRMFLASLQLANNGNVALHHGKNAAEQKQIPLTIELLTSENCYSAIHGDTLIPTSQ